MNFAKVISVKRVVFIVLIFGSSSLLAQVDEEYPFYNVTGSNGVTVIHELPEHEASQANDSVTIAKNVSPASPGLMEEPITTFVHAASLAKRRGKSVPTGSAAFDDDELALLSSILAETAENYASVERETLQSACSVLNDSSLSSLDHEQHLDLAWEELPTRDELAAVYSHINSSFLKTVRERLGENGLQNVLVVLDGLQPKPFGTTSRDLAESMGTDRLKMLNANCRYIPDRGW